MERWDLDALACVGRWEVPLSDPMHHLGCVGESPAGLRALSLRGLWGGPLRPGEGWIHLEAFRPDGPENPSVADLAFVTEDGATRAIRLADGATLWRASIGSRRFGVFVARGGRFVVLQTANTSFDVAEVVDPPHAGEAHPSTGSPRISRSTLRVIARLATDTPRASQHVALHADRRLLALPTEAGVVLGPWDDWWSARPLSMSINWLSLMEFTDDGGTLVICDGDCIRWVDVATREVREARIEGLPPGHRRYAPLDASSERVLCIVQGCLFVGEPGCDTLRTRAFDPLGDFTAAAGTADGRALITGSREGVVRVRDRASGAVLAVSEIAQPVVDVAASADGREVFVVGESGDLLRFGLASGAEIAREENLFDKGQVGATGFAVSADGRHVAVHNTLTDAAALAVIVDTATGARHFHRSDVGRRDFDGALCGVAFGSASRVRIACGPPLHGEPQAAECTERSLEGDDVALLVRWPSPDVGDEDAIEDCRHLLSRDGRLLWRLWKTEDLLEQVAVTAVDPPARLAYARWTLNAPFATLRAGRVLLAVVAGFATLWLLSGNGRSVRTEWPDGCRLLGFAPDDRALWVRDASGLVVEVVVPEELLEDLDRVAAPDPLRA